VNVSAANPPTVNDIVITGAAPENGKYKHTDILTLGNNTEVTGNTYAWTYTTNPLGRTVTFDQTANQTTPSPQISGFTKDTIYTFTLTVTNEFGVTSEKSVTVSVAANKLPTISSAGVTGGTLVGDKYEFDFTAAGNRSIQLAGSATDTDNGDTPLTYTWACTKKPTTANTPAIGTGANPAVSNFNELGDYEFTLTVTDKDGGEAVSSVVKVALYRTASATLNIDSNFFSAATGTQLDFAPTYSSVSNSADFTADDINGCLTYTVTVVTPNEAYTNTWNSTDSNFNGQIFPQSEYEIDLNTFTQTFYHNETMVGSRSLQAAVAGGIFQYFDEYNLSATIPAIDGVSLSRKVTKGNVN